MTTMSTSATMSAETHAEPKAKTRNLSLDRARTFLTLVVLLHHAVIPYTYFGHTDPKFFFGFDMIVLATDSFFMAMFFFLSGLFAWSGIARKGPASYLEDRVRRLGIPFVVCAFSVIPIAYYAISLRNNPEIGFSQFWWTTITQGPWPSGPIWFLWVLFAFDLIACLLYRIWPNLLDPINRLSVRGRRRPAEFFAVMLAVSAAFYVPGLMYFGPSSWFEFGPFSVQHGRVMLYATYFFFGAGIGVANMDRGLLSAEGRMAKVSWEWLVLAIVPYCLLWVLIFIKRQILGNPSPQPNWYEGIYALNVTVFSVAIMFLILAFFQRFRQSGSAMLLDPMQSAAFGMFLVHYPITLWLQYWLFDYNLPAVVKALTVFVMTVIFSWAVTAALRTIPGATRVL
ncbi:acyltransferase family protein [Bradyrhizobium guangzhouense]|uniref:Acyltransferase n=1 Tax=Bradyrhizobium guangzhouense TaxID=1325095 RepID=A0AAE5WZS0_9BRAD|nr:acyltransferase [Bradyrhizobium guangzhouense]QAU46156.1 acyltransferase [Bradyrhizobium guangzhouense]RXH17513.1 acyltransferase [Bradyrhizobium guangzhouense]